MDVHKSSFTYAVRDGATMIEPPRRRRSDEVEVRSLARKYPGARFILEACGPHEWMTDVIREEGCDVFACRPPKHDAEGPKSDKRDTLRLLVKHDAGDLKRVHVAPPATRRLRDLVRQRAFLVQQRTSLVVRVKHELIRWNRPADDIMNERERITREFPDLSATFAVLDTLEEETKRLTIRVKEEGRDDTTIQRLRTIPGFGEVVSLAFYATIDNIHRFENAHELTRYLGFDPKWKQSGDSLVDLHHISKTGDEYLMGLLVQAAWAHVNYTPDSDITHEYEALVARGKHKKIAIIAVARKLAEAAYRVWKNDRDFTLKRPATTPNCRPATRCGTRRHGD